MDITQAGPLMKTVANKATALHKAKKAKETKLKIKVAVKTKV